MAIDLRACLNAISDVVNNRPRPLWEFDQIFMKIADMSVRAFAERFSISKWVTAELYETRSHLSLHGAHGFEG